MPERIDCEVLQTECYINTFTFTFQPKFQSGWQKLFVAYLVAFRYGKKGGVWSIICTLVKRKNATIA